MRCRSGTCKRTSAMQHTNMTNSAILIDKARLGFISTKSGFRARILKEGVNATETIVVSNGVYPDTGNTARYRPKQLQSHIYAHEVKNCIQTKREGTQPGSIPMKEKVNIKLVPEGVALRRISYHTMYRCVCPRSRNPRCEYRRYIRSHNDSSLIHEGLGIRPLWGCGGRGG